MSGRVPFVGSERVVLFARNWTPGMDTTRCTDRGPRVNHPFRRFPNGE